jgi:ATP-dependent Clp protease ATP-binding subunit ClpA
MSRLIQDLVRKALADELLFGRLVNGGKVEVDMDADEKVKLELPPADSGDAPQPERGEPVLSE